MGIGGFTGWLLTGRRYALDSEPAEVDERAGDAGYYQDAHGLVLIPGCRSIVTSRADKGVGPPCNLLPWKDAKWEREMPPMIRMCIGLMLVLWIEYIQPAFG